MNDCFKTKRILNHDLGRVKSEMMKLNSSGSSSENGAAEEDNKTSSFKFDLIGFKDCENQNSPLVII